MPRSKSFTVMCGVTGTFEPLDTILDRLALRGVFPEQNAAVVGLRDHALKGRVERRRTPHDHRIWEYRLTPAGEEWLDAHWTPAQGEAA